MFILFVSYLKSVHIKFSSGEIAWSPRAETFSKQSKPVFCQFYPIHK